MFEDSKTRAAQPLRGQAAKTKLMFDAEEGFVLGHRKRPSEGSSIGTPIREDGFVLGHRKRPSDGSSIGTPIREEGFVRGHRKWPSEGSNVGTPIRE